jgi:hypothetical protein
MFDDLEQIVDQKFWKVINDLRVHATKKYRLPFLQDLKVKLKEYEYFPSLPLTVKEADKGHGVARQIPIFNLEDYSVYYYCVRKLELVIAKNRVEGTFGGWSMGGKIRKLENADEPAGEYQLTYSYNPAAWARYYGDFNAHVYGKIIELQSAGQGDHLVYELDIANYYDNIQLAILENKIRRDADYSESGVLDLLMYFLGYSNRLVTQYQKRSVGIPQDAFGDCSRLLSNYYLQDYDLYMSQLAKKHNATYFRYADDQMLFVPNEEVGEMLIQMASRRMSRIGLNINQKKVIKRTLTELYTYRSFEINDLFKAKDSNKDQRIVREFARMTFAAIDEDANCLRDRGYPLIKRLITADYNLLDASQRAKLMRYIFDTGFIKGCRAYTFTAAYTKMRQAEQTDFINLLGELIAKSKHSAFHYEILAFYRQHVIDTKALENRIADLRKDIYKVD